MNSLHSKSLYGTGICLILLVLFVDLVIAARQEPWEDEIFAVSTGWSLARSQAPMLSVLGDYPRTGSPISFYGPVSFETENWLIRVFGLSLFPWRFVCFLGVPLCILVCSALVKAAGGDRWARLATALFVALAGSVAGALPGRWDFITVAFFLSGVLLFIDNIAAKENQRALGVGFSWRSHRRCAGFVPASTHFERCCTRCGRRHRIQLSGDLEDSLFKSNRDVFNKCSGSNTSPASMGNEFPFVVRVPEACY